MGVWLVSSTINNQHHRTKEIEVESIKINGVVFTGIEVVSQKDGGSWKDGVEVPCWSNDIFVFIDEEASATLLSVEHWTNENSVWEVKQDGPFIYFAVWGLDRDVSISTDRGGAFGSKYLDVNRGGWSSRCDVYNELGITDKVVDVTVVRPERSKTLSRLTVDHVNALVAWFGKDIDVEEVVKEGGYSEKKLGIEVDAYMTFVNHSNI
jgi:hypothetical protein